MRTFKRICIKDFTVTDECGNPFTVYRGREYRTSEVDVAAAIGPGPVKGHVIVFSSHWVSVPVDMFAGEIIF